VKKLEATQSSEMTHGSQITLRSEADGLVLGMLVLNRVLLNLLTSAKHQTLRMSVTRWITSLKTFRSSAHYFLGLISTLVKDLCLW
jgi:hypothetical protein